MRIPEKVDHEANVLRQEREAALWSLQRWGARRAASEPAGRRVPEINSGVRENSRVHTARLNWEGLAQVRSILREPC